MINDIPFNCLLVNCRSLKPKIKSLVTNIALNRTHIALLTETWFQKGDRQLKSMLENTELESGIRFLRRDRDKRGGGVSILFDKKRWQ